jgi:hypothetical protein
VQDGMNMDFSFIRPAHQLSNKVGGFSGTVDVVYQIPYAVNNDKAKVLDLVNGFFNLF